MDVVVPEACAWPLRRLAQAASDEGPHGAGLMMRGLVVKVIVMMIMAPAACTAVMRLCDGQGGFGTWQGNVSHCSCAL